MSWILFIIGSVLWLLVGFKVTPVLLNTEVGLSLKLLGVSLIWLSLTLLAIACFWYGFVAMAKNELGINDD